MGSIRTFRGALAAALSASLLVASMALPAASAAAATADTTISVGSKAVGVFGSDMLGSNLTPWGGYWPNTRSAAPMHDAGLGLLRIGHGEKVYVDMEKWYPGHGKWDWDAPGTVPGVSHSFNEQIAWWKSLDIPLLYTLNDELSTAMLKADGSLNYDEIAYAWAGHIKYLVDQGVNIKYVEIGNECDIAPGEGIQYPPVENSSKTPSNKYLELHIGDPAYANGNNEYIRLWEAVVPAIHAAVPGIKVSPYPSGQGTVPSLSFPFDYLFQTAKAKPDFFPVHVYSFAAYSFIPTPQTLLDSTWQYSGRFVDWNGDVTTLADTLAAYGAASIPTGITEWNYDGAMQYDPGQGVNWGASQANGMWDALFAASVLANAANGGMDLTTFWETFPGSNTDELFDDDYTTTTPRSQGLSYKLLKQFAGGIVRASTVTSSDQAKAYDWENTAINIPGLAGARVECLATTDASGYRLLLINKNVSTQHVANVNLADLDSGTAVVKTYQTRDSLVLGAPSTGSNAAVTGGTFQVELPPMSVSVVTVSGNVADSAIVTLSGPSTPPDYNGRARLTAFVKQPSNNTRISDVPVVFERWSGGRWQPVQTKSTVAEGSASIYAYGFPSAQTFRARIDVSAGYVAAPTQDLVIKPYASVSNPIAPWSAYHGRSFTVYGSLKPRHPRDTYPVRVYRYRKVRGGWEPYPYVLARASNVSSYTQYSKVISVPYAGTWALRAYAPADGGHAGTWSTGYDYVYVK